MDTRVVTNEMDTRVVTDEVEQDLDFVPILPCLVCGQPTNCGSAFKADYQDLGTLKRLYLGCWILMPLCHICEKDKNRPDYEALKKVSRHIYYKTKIT